MSFLTDQSWHVLKSWYTGGLVSSVAQARLVLSQKLQKLQNLAVRIMNSSNYDASLAEFFQSLNWHKLELQRTVLLFVRLLMKLTFRFTSSVSGTRSKSEHLSGRGALKCSIPRFCGKKIDEYLFGCLDLSRGIFFGGGGVLVPRE